MRSVARTAVLIVVFTGCFEGGTSDAPGGPSPADTAEIPGAGDDLPGPGDVPGEAGGPDGADATPGGTCAPGVPAGSIAMHGVSASYSGEPIRVAFDGAQVRLHARSAPGARDDGCVAAVDVTLTRADGCALTVRADGSQGPLTEAPAGEPLLPVTIVRLAVSPACAAVLGVAAGDYSWAEMKLQGVRVTPRRIEADPGDPACALAAIRVHLYGTLAPPGEDPALYLDSLGDPATAPTVAGSFPFDRSPGVACPFACSCEGRVCGDDGCGGSCGTCVGCGGAPVACLPDGTCPVFCCPACTGKACGPDGCGGLCGTCAAGSVCHPATGTCEAPCTDAPAAWGPAGAVDDLRIPMQDAGAACFDYTGDGQGDNSLAAFGSQVDGLAAGVVGRVVAVVEPGVDLSADGSFDLWVLPATPASDRVAGDVVVDRAWLSDVDCGPRVRLAATLQGGVLAAEAPSAEVPVRWGDLPGHPTTLAHLRLKGTVAPGAGPDGFALADGVASFLWSAEAWGTLKEAWQADCTALPKDQRPDPCQYLFVTSEGWPFDLNCQDDGTCTPRTHYYGGDTASLCFAFSLAKARVAGVAP